MNFDLSKLRAFVAVAELRSFHLAAETLHLSQSALSRRIGKLERALGVRLFGRTTRRVALTAAGRDFSHKARSLIDDLEGFLLGIRELAATRMGEITVVCVPSAVEYFLPPALLRHQACYPNIRVRIVGEGATEVLSSGARGEAEFGSTTWGLRRRISSSCRSCASPLCSCAGATIRSRAAARSPGRAGRRPVHDGRARER